jgi:hypothetical protein
LSSLIKLAAFAATVACLPLLNGCGSLRLYSETRDKQGAAAREAWSKVDLTTLVTTERANLKSLLETELDTQDRLAASIRDNRLRYVAEAPSVREGVLTPADTLLATLAGSAAQVEASRANVQSESARAAKIAALRPDFEARNLKVPACSRLENGATPDELAEQIATDAELKLIVTRLRSTCGTASDIYAGLSGQIKTALDDYNAEVNRLSELQLKAASLRAEYKKSLKAYENAVAGKPDENGAVQTVQNAAKRVKAAVEALQGASDAFSIQFLSKERLESLDEFIKAVTQTKPGDSPPPGANDATLAFVVFPGLFDDARKALADAKKPLAMPLLMRRNHAQLNLESATREIEAREAMVKLRRELVDTLYAESVQLWLVTRDLNLNAKYLSLSVQDAFKKATADDKELLYTASARYLDVLRRFEAKRYKLEYMLIAASYERALAASEVNVKQWQSLIGTSVDQLADYSAGGIKTEQITNLLNAAALIWIGNGVNK